MPCRALLAGLTLGLVFGIAGPAVAEHPADCFAVNWQSSIDFPLKHVSKAIGRKNLRILVVGAGSSRLPGAEGQKNSYPARLQFVLGNKLPGVAVTVETDIRPTRTAAEMLATMPTALAAAKPDLVVWQTATVDAMRSVDPEQFSQALDRGIGIARAGGADVIFLNPQYSPRTESMIALGTYVENMRWVAVQQRVPVFDRFNLMKAWSDSGIFDLYSTTKKLDMAEQVHDCLARMMAALIIEAATTAGSHSDSTP